MTNQGFQKLPDIAGDSDEDTVLLRAMATSAQQYITSFSWCQPIEAMYLAFGVGGVVAVFLVEFVRKIDGTDQNLWVIVGDLPSAYLVVEAKGSPKCALEGYCELMEDWIQSVGSLETDDRQVFPVAAEPTTENANLLRRRVEFLRKEIIPQIRL